MNGNDWFNEQEYWAVVHHTQIAFWSEQIDANQYAAQMLSLSRSVEEIEEEIAAKLLTSAGIFGGEIEA